MPSQTDMAEHARAFDYPVKGDWGSLGDQLQLGGMQTDSISVHSTTP